MHPSGLTGRSGSSFVPNDIILGGGGGGERVDGERGGKGGEGRGEGGGGSEGGPAAPLVLLSGPNMGGKSTLLRQVCLAAIMAQVGAWVPAQSLRLHPVDSIFVRMGAKDHIVAGQSTFYVELAETAAMLQKV